MPQPEYRLHYTNQFERDYRRLLKRGKDMAKLCAVLDLLTAGKSLPAEYRDHGLKGRWQGARDCHIEPDWVLIYRQDKGELVLYALATGTHADPRLS
jgi:mRNA interferase YafQ